MKTIEELLESESVFPDRPPSLDEKGHRIDIYPATVSGKFRNRRNVFYTFLLFIFLVLPWTTFQGRQTILLDLPSREFIFFGNIFKAHDAPMIFFIFGIVVFGLLMATSLYGRVWCGWACPQTVFIDMLYRRVEEWIEGNHVQRKKLSKAPWTKKKIFKKSLKWFLFVVISSHIAHSFTAYFVGAKELVGITLSSPEANWSLFVFVQVFTLLTLLDFGWFREQFCLVACPYGRLQAAIMDTKSKTVMYDYKRGEPRRQKKGEPFADCVNCFKCVSVCPTGIDIRNGQQIECIGCTACIDACDDVMKKVNKPTGLIRYASEEEIELGKENTKFNLRPYIYSSVLFALILVFSILLFLKDSVAMKVVRAGGAPYTLTDQGGQTLITNHFKIHLINQSSESVEALNIELLDKSLSTRLVSPLLPSSIPSGEELWVHVFVTTEREEVGEEGALALKWKLNFKDNKVPFKNGEFKILGPEN